MSSSKSSGRSDSLSSGEGLETSIILMAVPFDARPRAQADVAISR